MTDKKATLLKLNENLNILKEREAKYGGGAPLDLLNQIVDHEQAITLTRQVITGELSEDKWCEALKPLLLAINNGQVVNIEAETYVAGDVIGDIVAGDKVLGDKVLGDKIITVTYEAPPPPLPPAEARERRDLGILLNKVKTFWIEGVLEKSVHRMALIDLGKETQTEAVAHAWEQVLELPDQSRQTLSPDKKIGQIFDEMNSALLILGEPGSGKTITLLQLAQELIAQAEGYETFSQPVPVIFNLSSWLNKGQPLIDWMVNELTAKYQIPKRIGRSWLENNRLLPLLDGLDEVKLENQAGCVEAINHFGEEFGFAGLAVCSRIKEYTSLPVRLKLNGAIRLQPLTLEQIYDYLDSASPKLDTLRIALQSDDRLQELAQSPLNLGIMTLAYQDMRIEDLTTQALDTVEARRRHLFDTYIEQMFKRKGQREKLYTDEQTKDWLRWLARQMDRHNLSVFLIEQLQPSWLPTRSWRLVYVLTSRTLSCLIVGMSEGLISTIIVTWLTVGMTEQVSFGLVVGLSIGLIDALRFEKSRKDVIFGKIPTGYKLVINTLAVAFVVGLIIGLVFGLKDRLIVWLILGLIFGQRGSWQTPTNDIQTVEALSWSFGRALRGVIVGFIVGLIAWLIFGAMFGVIGGLIGGLIARVSSGVIDRVIVQLIVGLTFGLAGGLIGAMFGGLGGSILKTKTIPNQGIQLSTRNALFTGLSFGLIFILSFGLGEGLINGILGGLREGVRSGLIGGLSFGLSFGLFTALWYGALDVIQHYTLRLILWHKGHVPRNYAHFLDYAVERIFLQKVGGGYIFVHRLLLEHFADRDEFVSR